MLFAAEDLNLFCKHLYPSAKHRNIHLFDFAKRAILFPDAGEKAQEANESKGFKSKNEARDFESSRDKELEN